ncbi:MAG TPA: prolyl oligopeptidase family serine peptidase [Terriglobia bacterium]|nr:prolyl oligopeptidase family serine peptidase [Terriglobia bacterium]
MGVRRFIPPTWALAWGFTLVFALSALLLPEPHYQLEYTRIKNGRGMPFWVILYYPQPAKFPRAPGAVVCQPLNDSPEYSRMLDLELVHDGFVVLAFDWRGRSPEENRQLLRVETQQTVRSDVAAAVAYLRTRPEVDPEKVVIAGHSVGGTMAIEEGMSDLTLRAVVSVGMEADTTPHQPRNLLWALGLYDEFRGLSRMRAVLRESTGTEVLENTTVGDFAHGTARRLGVSPSSDHFSELQDREIHRMVVDWFRQAVGLPARTRPMWMETRGLLVMLAWVAALTGALLTLRRIALNSPHRVWILRAAIAAALLGVILLTRVRGLEFLQATDAVFDLAVMVLLAGLLCSLDAETYRRAWRFGWRSGLVLWASLLVTFLVNNIPFYFQTPRYLLWFPEFAPRHLLDLADGYVLAYARPILFSVYAPDQLTPRLWVYAMMALMLAYPEILAVVVAWLRRPSAQAAASNAHKPVSMVSVALLIVILIFLGAVVWLRIGQGFLTRDSALAALKYMLRFTVLPFFVFALLWRWTGKKTVDRRQ